MPSPLLYFQICPSPLIFLSWFQCIFPILGSRICPVSRPVCPYVLKFVHTLFSYPHQGIVLLLLFRPLVIYLDGRDGLYLQGGINAPPIVVCPFVVSHKILQHFFELVGFPLIGTVQYVALQVVASSSKYFLPYDIPLCPWLGTCASHSRGWISPFS